MLWHNTTIPLPHTASNIDLNFCPHQKGVIYFLPFCDYERDLLGPWTTTGGVWPKAL